MTRRRAVLLGLLGAAGVAGALALLDSDAGRSSTDATVSNDGPWTRVTLRVDGMS
jgi:hypothetical protein